MLSLLDRGANFSRTLAVGEIKRREIKKKTLRVLCSNEVRINGQR